MITLQGYSYLWPWLYRKEWLLLRLSLGTTIQDIEHFGSTSIPGMVAKPVLDILLCLDKYESAHDWVASLTALGYRHEGEK